jgi:cytochrome c oxidase cbb3-type subunit 3
MKSTMLRVVIYGVFLVCLGAMLAGGATEGAGTAAGAQTSADAAALYAKHCAKCHGKDGRANTLKAKFNKARDLTGADWQRQASNERIFNSIMHGGGKMPAFKKKLSEAQVESLVVHVRSFRK